MQKIVSDFGDDQALRRSGGVFQEIFERAGVGMAQIDADTSRFVRANAAYCELTGYSEYELRTMSLCDLQHPEDRDGDRRLFQNVRHTLVASSQTERRYVCKGGRIMWVLATVSPLRGEDGAVTGFVTVVQDATSRRHAEAAARSDDRLRRFVEDAPAAVAMFDCDMRYLAASGRWKTERGLSDDIVGRSHYDVITDQPEHWIAIHRRALAGETLGRKEDLFVGSNGRARWVDWEARPWYDADNRPGGIVIGAEDVTARVMAQRRVLGSEAQLRFVTDHAPALLVHCDADGRFRFANRPYAERFGLRPEEIVGRRIADVLGPEAYEQLRPFVESALSGAEAEFEEVVSYPYGARWMRCTYMPERGSDGAVLGFVAVIQDVTARREAEEALRLHDATLQGFLDAAPIALVRTTCDLRYRAVNAAYAKLVGVPADQIVGRSLGEILGEEALERIRPFLDRVASGDRVEFEDELSFAGYGPRWIHAIYTPERDSAGIVIGWVVSIIDISHQKRTEAALRAGERSQRLLAEIGDIAARIADVASLMSAVGERIAWTYGISRCGFALVDMEGGKLVITDDYHGDLQSVAGVYPLERHTEYWKDDAVAGRTVMLPDLATDPRTADIYPVALAPLRVRAQIMVPLYRHGRWVATFWVADDKTRHWTSEEADSLKLVGERVWNVVERTRAEDAVRASEEHLRLVTDQAPVLLVHCDRETRYRFVNAPYTTRFGLRPEDVVGRKIREVVGEPAYASLAPYVEAVLGGERVEFEQQIPYAYGLRWMHCTYVPQIGTDGSIDGLVAVIQDVTSRRLAEDSLRESEERFRATFENAAVGMAHVALDGALVRVNDRLCAILGYSREQLRQLTFEQLTHPDDRDVDREYKRQILSGDRQTYTVEQRQICANGKIAWITLTVSLVRTADSASAYFVAIIEDITARKRAEDALRDAARNKDEFLAMLAHELRNPLAPIRTAASLLATSDVTDPIIVRSRAVIDRQVTHMARLLDDLLDVSRLSRGTLPLQRAPVLLSDILRAAIEVSGPMFAVREQHLTLEGVDDPHVLEADRERLTQVFANLLNNAANYSGRGAHIHVIVRRDGAAVLVAVRDSGIGISEDMIDRIFELFTRSHAAEEHAPGGLGIGLSLARRVVELHGGTIAVASEGVGKGSEFTVRLPATPAAPPMTPAEAAPDKAADRNYDVRVLVVDDNTDAADMLALLLSGVGCDVRTAYRGHVALQEAERFRPDLLLLDIGLPDMSGHEVCRRIREQEWGRSMVIVAVTGWGQDADRQRSVHAGFDRHLVKPVDHDEIIALARDLNQS
jgi:PAS domain S-box-containing protein